MGVAEVTASSARLRELGACLRAHRRLIRPADVGLPGSGRRRTPGLRREEVASLAGVGLSWYTWLEQGRVTASGQVLDAVGRVLRLDADGRAHLRRLSAPVPAPPARPDLRSLLDSWPDSPAAQLDHRLDVVAANRGWTAALGAPTGNVVWRLADAGAPWPLLRAVATRFRMAADLQPDDPRIRASAEALRADFPEQAPLWDCRGVGAFGAPTVDVAGRRRRAHLLHPTGRPDAAVLVLT
jgi:transcriptional regulator with XRE-family HTH domain